MSSNIRVEKFSEPEKERLRTLLKKRLLVLAVIYLTIIAVSISIMVYFNKYSTAYYIKNNLEVINVAFVIITVLCGRLLVSEVIEFGKEAKATEKKIVEAKVTGRKGNKISIGDKNLGMHDFILDNSGFDSLRVGDNVRIELSAKSGTLFTIKRI